MVAILLQYYTEDHKSCSESVYFDWYFKVTVRVLIHLVARRRPKALGSSGTP